MLSFQNDSCCKEAENCTKYCAKNIPLNHMASTLAYKPHTLKYLCIL